MITIKRAYDGRVCFLSDETYKIDIDIASYPKGTEVRLISGIDGNTIPGYHFSEGYATVCRVDAKVAEFVGIQWKNLKEIIIEDKNAIRLTEMKDGYDGRPTRLEVMDGDTVVFLQHVEGCGYEVYHMSPEQSIKLGQILQSAGYRVQKKLNRARRKKSSVGKA